MSRLKAFIVSGLLLLLAMGAPACGGGGGQAQFTPVTTNKLRFVVDKEVNSGQLLPVDVIYVTLLHDLKDVTALGPTAWFNSSQRDQWHAKESFSLSGGEDKMIPLNPQILAKTSYLVVFTSFMGVEDPSRQQVVIDPGAYHEETILVHPSSIEPTNPRLKQTY